MLLKQFISLYLYIFAPLKLNTNIQFCLIDSLQPLFIQFYNYLICMFKLPFLIFLKELFFLSLFSSYALSYYLTTQDQ